jgi:hypothetical protein
MLQAQPGGSATVTIGCVDAAGNRTTTTVQPNPELGPSIYITTSPD